MLYVFINFKNLKETHVKQGLLINFIFIVIITSLFWAPMLEARLSTDYQVYQENAMATKESVAQSALDVKRLFVTPKGDYIFELGIHIIIMLCFSIMSLKTLKEDAKKQYIFFLIAGIISVIMSTKLWPWKFMPSIFCFIQFPWRMLFIADFFLSIVCSINMYVVFKKFNFKDIIVITIICILYVCAFYSNIPRSHEVVNIQNWNLGIVSGRENEVVAGMGKGEYLPKKAFENTFYIATREQSAYVLKGKAIIDKEEKNGNYYTADIRTAERTILELPYIYYPGYKVTADGVLLYNFETPNGFLGVEIPEKENVELVAEYTGTTVMNITKIISVLGIILFSIYVWKKH